MVAVSSVTLNLIKYIKHLLGNVSIELAADLGKRPVLLRKPELPSMIIAQRHKPALNN
jgi:hypothetical protein